MKKLLLLVGLVLLMGHTSLNAKERKEKITNHFKSPDILILKIETKVNPSNEEVNIRHSKIRKISYKYCKKHKKDAFIFFTSTDKTLPFAILEDIVKLKDGAYLQRVFCSTNFHNTALLLKKNLELKNSKFETSLVVNGTQGDLRYKTITCQKSSILKKCKKTFYNNGSVRSRLSQSIYLQLGFDYTPQGLLDYIHDLEIIKEKKDKEREIAKQKRDKERKEKERLLKIDKEKKLKILKEKEANERIAKKEKEAKERIAKKEKEEKERFKKEKEEQRKLAIKIAKDEEEKRIKLNIQKKEEQAKIKIIDEMKVTCRNIGFKDNTETMSNCVLQLMLRELDSKTKETVTLTENPPPTNNTTSQTDTSSLAQSTAEQNRIMEQQTLIMEKQLRMQRLNQLRKSQKTFQSMMDGTCSFC